MRRRVGRVGGRVRREMDGECAAARIDARQYGCVYGGLTNARIFHASGTLTCGNGSLGEYTARHALNTARSAALMATS